MILISSQKPFFMVFVTDLSEKKPEFLAVTFFLGGVFLISSAEKRPEYLEKTYLFWSTGMVAAHWQTRTLLGVNVAN